MDTVAERCGSNANIHLSFARAGDVNDLFDATPTDTVALALDQQPRPAVGLSQQDGAALTATLPEGVPPSAAGGNKLLLPRRTGVINAPGVWNFMISYTQRNATSEALAYKIYGELLRRHQSVWLDVQMSKRDEAAMKEGVQHAACVIAIVSGPAGDDSAYFRRPFCISELRWAAEAGIPVVPVVAAEDKGQITEFFADIPADLQHLKGVNWEHIDRKDVDYFELGITKIMRAAAEQPQPQPEPQPEPELEADSR